MTFNEINAVNQCLKKVFKEQYLMPCHWTGAKNGFVGCYTIDLHIGKHCALLDGNLITIDDVKKLAQKMIQCSEETNKCSSYPYMKPYYIHNLDMFTESELEGSRNQDLLAFSKKFKEAEQMINNEVIELLAGKKDKIVIQPKEYIEQGGKTTSKEEDLIKGEKREKE